MKIALQSSLFAIFTFICAGGAASGAVGCASPTRTFSNGEGGSGGAGGDVTTSTSSSGGGGSGQGGSGGVGGQGGAGGVGGQGGSAPLCATDTDCLNGKEWCVGGSCVPCDNSGLACDIACDLGWKTYTRNGCYPCACAPPNACTSDSACMPGEKCYAGQFCWDWCPPGDPTCCYGNACSDAGCPDPYPAGCVKTGCPQNQTCQVMGACGPSTCSCLSPLWACTKDCGGGECVF